MMGQTERFENRPTKSTGRCPAETGARPIRAVFVYGTLRRGGCRQPLWPAVPLRVEPAWTRGALFARPDYPAMTAGDDRVLGEWWLFPADAMPRVIAVLDEIEGVNQPRQPDLYHRVTLDVFTLDSRPLGQAFGYFYAADPSRDGFRRLHSAGKNFVQWSEDASP